MKDFDMYLTMLQNAKHKIKTVRDKDIETEPKEYNFIVTEDKERDGIIIVAKFELTGELVEIFLADACNSIDDF